MPCPIQMPPPRREHSCSRAPTGASSFLTVTTIGISCRRTSNMKMPITQNAIRITAAGLAFLLPALLLGDNGGLTGDSSINPGDSTAYGTLPILNVGGAANAEGLLQFDLSKLAPGTTGASVTAAT